MFVEIESLDGEGRGIAHYPAEHESAGKVIFVDGALPTERARIEITRKKSNFELANAIDITHSSNQRVKPGCKWFGVCGGCAMQHLDARAQVSVKQRILEDNLARIGGVQPELVFRPLQGASWGYRHRARLSVRLVFKKNAVLVGFHEKKNRYIADMTSCAVLPPHVSALLLPLRELIGQLSIAQQVPQIELALGDSVTALALRVLTPPSPSDIETLSAFEEAHQGTHPVQFWLQPKGPETVALMRPLQGTAKEIEDRTLAYSLPEFAVRMPFMPTDFTQVNHAVNRWMVVRALQLLEVQAHHRVADWFCGLGNFTLPLATQSAQVLGLEGSDSLITRARANSALNGLANKTEFKVRNLFEVSAQEVAALGHFDRMLIDPPRDGAIALVSALAQLSQHADYVLPDRIVYVSCSPATLARDAAVLVQQAGYRLAGAGVINMFPHTAHVESMALFVR